MDMTALLDRVPALTTERKQHLLAQFYKGMLSEAERLELITHLKELVVRFMYEKEAARSIAAALGSIPLEGSGK